MKWEPNRSIISIIGIDPGPMRSAVVLWDARDRRVLEASHLDNEVLRDRLRDPSDQLYRRCDQLYRRSSVVAIEKIVSYGMRVGESTFQTAYWIGRFHEAIEHAIGSAVVTLVARPEVKLALCHTARATDADVRDALIARYGQKGTKKEPGPLYLVKGHCWSALAVAATLSEVLIERERHNTTRKS